MRRIALLLAAQAATSLAPDAGPHQLETSFRLDAVHREGGATIATPVPLIGTDGATPISAPHWSCSWTLRDGVAYSTLAVQCWPLIRDQSVTTSINCDRTAPSTQFSILMLTTRDNFEQADAPHATELKLFCETH